MKVGMAMVMVAVTAAFAVCLPAAAQNLLRADGGGTVIGTDLAVLEAREQRKDLPCMVTPVKPVLGFDLRFHAGYEIVVPLRELAGAENLLAVTFRVTNLDKKNDPVYLVQKFRVPEIAEDAKGDAYLEGSFDLGEGRYQVDWLMRDRAERVCASFWESEAVLPPRDKVLVLTMQAGQVGAAEKEEFAAEPVVEHQAGERPLSVKVLVNFAPQNPRASSLQPMDTSALVSILRTIQRDSRIGRFSVVAFNLQQQAILYRQDAEEFIDFPAIGDALKGLRLGRVEIGKLQQKSPETDFLSELIRSEFKTNGALPDAMIIAGPKAMLDQNISLDALKSVGEPAYPVFYMNYSLFPQQTPWRDSISHAVRHFKGQEFTISRPRDLWLSVSEMVGKIVKFKAEKHAGTAGATSRGFHEVAVQ